MVPVEKFSFLVVLAHIVEVQTVVVVAQLVFVVALLLELTPQTLVEQ